MEKQTFLELLEASGIQVRQALDRLMGNEELYLSFLAKLPGQLHFEDILRALGEEDEEAFYLGVHNLKGLTGNLGLTPIHDCAQAILVEFRASRFQHRNKLTALTWEAKRESEHVAALIEGYFGEGARA